MCPRGLVDAVFPPPNIQILIGLNVTLHFPMIEHIWTPRAAIPLVLYSGNHQTPCKPPLQGDGEAFDPERALILLHPGILHRASIYKVPG